MKMVVPERLQGLGTEKVQRINNDLMLGKPCQALSREIRSEWGDLQDVAEKTLTQQLTRYKAVLVAEAGVSLTKGGKVDMRSLRDKLPLTSTMQELSALMEVQWARLQRMVDEESTSGKHNVHINPIVEDIKLLAIDLQKIRFDVGADEFKGVVPGIRGMAEKTTAADGSSTQRLMFDAITTVEKVLERRLGA